MVSSETVYKTKKCLVKSGKDIPLNDAFRSIAAYFPQRTRVLSAKYDSLFREVSLRFLQSYNQMSSIQ